MKFGIIGGGFGVDGHLAALTKLPAAEVIAVADSGSGRVKARMGAQGLYRSSWRDLLDDAIDAVCIATPPNTHLDMVTASASM